ncbi:sulfatase [Roseiconus nitratireducens]|uniref:Sulfatase n=1 Tax=Roseiconus nitratireducens TaxID=2605748 RepID=A0A5M6D5U2_9BACT|nr:sulfatase [Roseiconus nitratireducens]KAA5542116.1 sulfatase [Roseiconus nitratireducens]
MHRILLCLLLGIGVTTADAARPNVLFIAVDDLRPQLGCYGQTQIQSPNIDRLARNGVQFNRAFCMVPTCGASRASMLTGIRPARDRFVNYLTWAERDAPDVTTMNTHFQNNGYRTLSLGKIFHHPQDNGDGWSEPAWRPRGVQTYRLEENQKLHAQNSKKKRNPKRGPPFEAADVSDDAYADGVLAEKALEQLQSLADGDQPFFLAVGFFKPHLPFVAPQRYWDLYDHDRIELPQNYSVPENAPSEAIHNFGELRAYHGVPPKGPVTDEMARNLIHGYYACVSYTDAQIGKLLDELDRLGIADDTIVVLWGDHGWNLGEHTLWCKHCCFETSMRIPLIVKAPGIQGDQRRDHLIESIDIYPSLCDLAGLEQPSHLQGDSFVGVMRDAGSTWKSAAVGRFRDGDTIRTDGFRFTEYTAAKGKLLSRMLYNHQLDPNENVNLADQPQQIETVEQLTNELHHVNAAGK